jgi:regulator of sigma E protease
MDIILFIVALSILVLVHEFGHYLAAVKTGVWVEEFGLGLPPRIKGKKIGKTVFSLNALPIGGFCKMYGEDFEEAKDNRQDSFLNKNPWQKMLIVLGGVAMNILLAVVIFTAVYAITGLPVETDRVKIVEVSKDSPAAAAGLKEGMWVYKVNGEIIDTPDQLTKEVAKHKGQQVDLTVKNDGQETDYMVEVRANPPAGEGSMGVVISNTEIVKMKWYELYKGVGAGFKEAYYWGKQIIDGLGMTIAQLFAGRVPKDVSGPIGMYQATSAIKKNQGLLAVFHFFGLVSVNLAVVNVLPFPALDGGRLIFVIYELISRKRVNPRVEAMVNSIGMVLLLSLIVLITVGDIQRVLGQ